MNNQRMRVAVTGLGAVTALGHSVTEMFGRLVAGERAFSDISEFDVACSKFRIAAEIKNFRVSDIAPIGKTSLYSRADALAVAAAEQALRQSGLREQDLFLAVGSTSGGMREAEPVLMADPAQGMDARLAQRLITYPLFNSAKRIAGVIQSVRHTATFCSACSSSATAIVQDAIWVATGRCDCAIAGGTDSLSLLTLTGFAALGAMSSDPCRPFDQARSGMSLGEGAAFLVLESESHALKRGADVLAWLDGWSLGAEAHHITHPEPSGVTAAGLISAAIRYAGLLVDDIGYFNAHGTGTLPNDSMEANAVRLAFGAHVDQVRVSTAKGQLGHTLGASGAVEAAITVLALRERRLPPTMGLTTVAEDTRLNHIMGESISTDCRHALSSSFGFGGLGAVLAISHVDTPNRIPKPAEQRLVITDVFDAQPLSDPLSELNPDRSRRFDRVTAQTCVGAGQSTADAVDCGLVVANAYGNVERLHGYLARLQTKGIRGIAPAEFPHLIPSAIAGITSIYLGLTGPVTTISEEAFGCDTALDFACGLVQLGFARSMVAGVVEARDTGSGRVQDPFGVFSNAPNSPDEVCYFFRVETEEQARAQLPIARILEVWVGQGPWYQYFLDHEAPRQLSRHKLLFCGIDAAALAELPEVGQWIHAERIEFQGKTANPLGRSGAALAAAVRFIARGEADEVLLISKAPTAGSIIHLARFEQGD